MWRLHPIHYISFLSGDHSDKMFSSRKLWEEGNNYSPFFIIIHSQHSAVALLCHVAAATSSHCLELLTVGSERWNRHSLPLLWNNWRQGVNGDNASPLISHAASASFTLPFKAPFICLFSALLSVSKVQRSVFASDPPPVAVSKTKQRRAGRLGQGWGIVLTHNPNGQLTRLQVALFELFQRSNDTQTLIRP